MSLVHIPVEDTLDDVDITVENELKVKSRDSDNTIIIELLMDIRDLLIELTD